MPNLLTRTARPSSRLLASGSWLLALGFCLLAAFLNPARASHAIGSDLHYVNVGPGLYLVTYRFYRDCSGIAADTTSVSMSYQATGCGTSGTGTNSGGSMQLPKRGYQDGNPYCRAILMSQPPCDPNSSVSSGSYPNHQVWSYAGIVNLGTGPNAECSDWILSVEINARPAVANLLAEGDLYSEARLNTRDVSDDSSPVFSTLGGLQPLAYMCDSATIRYNCGVVDPNGDSLVYSLASALNGHNSPDTYAPGYSPTNPVRTLAGSPPISIDANGTLIFTAGANDPNVGSNQNENNKFTIVLQVDAYRRVNGQVVRTGRVRRDVEAIIVPCTSLYAAPYVPVNGITAQVGTQPATLPNPGDIISATANQPVTATFQLYDAASDSIYVQVDSASLPAGATYSVGALTVTPSTSYRTITFSWTPASADARSQPYVIHFAAQDNGCPVPQRACFVLPIHVPVLRPTGLPAVSAQPRATAYPNPFTTETRLTLPGGITRQPTEVLITDALGRLVDRLSVPAGEHTLIWRPRADVRPGLYYARVPGFRHTIALSRL